MQKMDELGIEPKTFCTLSRRATNCATRPLHVYMSPPLVSLAPAVPFFSPCDLCTNRPLLWLSKARRVCPRGLYHERGPSVLAPAAPGNKCTGPGGGKLRIELLLSLLPVQLLSFSISFPIFCCISSPNLSPSSTFSVSKKKTRHRNPT